MNQPKEPRKHPILNKLGLYTSEQYDFLKWQDDNLKASMASMFDFMVAHEQLNPSDNLYKEIESIERAYQLLDEAVTDDSPAFEIKTPDGKIHLCPMSMFQNIVDGKVDVFQVAHFNMICRTIIKEWMESRI